MTYICFVESDILRVPHMEPLAAETVEQARDEARLVLDQHASGIAAHVMYGDTRVFTLRRETA